MTDEIKDFKIEGFEKQIEILKENKENGTITRNEIADLQRSISLIKYGIEVGQKSKEEEIYNYYFGEYKYPIIIEKETFDEFMNLKQQLTSKDKEFLKIIDEKLLEINKEIPKASEELCCSKIALLQFERNLLESIKNKLEKKE